jgi:hypothetical protein
MSEEIDTRITPSLHARNVREIDGYDDETGLVLGQTEAAFQTAYDGLRSIHDARTAAFSDPTMTPAGALLKTADFSDKVFERITRAFDAEANRLEKAVTHLESEMSAPVESRAAASMANEIRLHAKGLSTNERMSLIRTAIAEGDERTATAILGAPAYLSGLEPQIQAVLLRQYHEKANPRLAKRLKALTAAKALLENNSRHVWAERDKAVGYITDPKTKRKLYAHELRKAKTEADKPFARVS